MMPKKKIALCVGIYLLAAATGTIAYLADSLPDHPHTKHGWLLLFFVFAPLCLFAEAVAEGILEMLGHFLTRTWRWLTRAA